MTPAESPRSAAASQADDCQVLFLLFSGAAGPVHVGHLQEAGAKGRLVALRRVPLAHAATLGPLVEQARALTHARVSKVLSLVTRPDAAYVASEYVDGVTVHELLQAAARHRTAGLPLNVATRIAHDALLAAAAVQKLRPEATADRYLFADTIWLTTYGATLMSEPGLAHALSLAAPASKRAPREVSPEHTEQRLAFVDDATTDLRAAVGLMCQMLRQPETELGTELDVRSALQGVDEALASVVVDAWEGRYESLEQFAHALALLSGRALGSEQDVARCVKMLVGMTLEMRQQLTSALDMETLKVGHDDATAFFSAQSHGPGVSQVMPKAPALEPAPQRPVFVSQEPVAFSLDDLAEGVEDDQEKTTAFRPSRIPRSTTAAVDKLPPLPKAPSAPLAREREPSAGDEPELSAAQPAKPQAETTLHQLPSIVVNDGAPEETAPGPLPSLIPEFRPRRWPGLMLAALMLALLVWLVFTR